MNVFLANLGCAKNQIDGELMLGQLIHHGWAVTGDPEMADLIIVNTCGFIQPAEEESIDTILELALQKEQGNCRRLIVTGCLPQRHGPAIVDALPEVDVFLGTAAYDQIVAAALGNLDRSEAVLPHPESRILQNAQQQRIRSLSHLAYIKVSEGCSRRCTYCIIPKLRGTQRSRSEEDILYEAGQLLTSGVQELVLVAQDTTAYGLDLSDGSNCARLLKKLSDLASRTNPDAWIRILYGHPVSIDEPVIDVITGHDNICSYFDIPIQHAHDRVLKRMGRHYTRDDLLRLFDTIRSKDPKAALRTTVIVGFPGETEAEFESLMDLVRQVRFDHLGAFIYSDAQDLPSHNLSHHVPKPVAQQRQDALMALQLDISEQNLKAHQGKKLKVLVENRTESCIFTGRTQFQAPEVDGLTHVHDPEQCIVPGTFAWVHVQKTTEYDLIGVAECKS